MKRIISWNVNGIRAAEKKGFLDWIAASGADVVCIQETKARKEQLSPELLAPAYAKKVYVEGNPKGAQIIADGVAQTEETQFDGTINNVTFKATAAGTYTIVYKAIDYSGVEVEKTYSVVVK